MAAIKKSVRLVDKTLEILNNLTISGEVNFSGTINEMAQQYELIMNESLPKLSDGEKHLILCAFNGYMPSQNLEQELKILPWHLTESYKYDSNARDLIDDNGLENLLGKINNWTNTEKIAVIYMARSFWRSGKAI